MDLQYEFGDPDRIAARLEFHRRVIAEEEAATEICNEALAGPSAWWKNAITQADGYRTAGMVEILIQRSRQIDGGAPLDSLLLADIAAEVADSIPIEAYPYDHVAKIRGRALREKAFMLSYVGRLAEAAMVAERSAHCLSQIEVPPPEMAKLDLVRSNIARQQQKFDLAIRFARDAAETFQWFGSRHGWLQAREYEAGARAMAGDHRQALEIYRSMGEYVHEMTPEQRAARRHNMGVAAAAAGEFEEAARAYAHAAEDFASLGNVVDGVRCRGAAAHALFSAGKVKEAIPLLEKVRKEFEGLGMEIEAALVALRLVEARMLTGDTDQVPEICRTLIDRFTRAGILGSAMTALAFLRETVATGRATPVLVDHVHGFLRYTRMVADRPFEPPPDQVRGEL
jgi:tetratricopeptide (TPR) repeat protein